MQGRDRNDGTRVEKSRKQRRADWSRSPRPPNLTARETGRDTVKLDEQGALQCKICLPQKNLAFAVAGSIARRTGKKFKRIGLACYAVHRPMNRVCFRRRRRRTTPENFVRRSPHPPPFRFAVVNATRTRASQFNSQPAVAENGVGADQIVCAAIPNPHAGINDCANAMRLPAPAATPPTVLFVELTSMSMP